MNINKYHLFLTGLGGVITGLVLAGPIHSQESRGAAPGNTQQVLLEAPLSQFPGKQIRAVIGEFEPDSATPLHRHPGTEILYVLEGEGVMEIKGREPQQLKPGRIVLVEPDPGSDSFTHRAINLSETNRMKNLVLIIHDEGTPPALPPKD